MKNLTTLLCLLLSCAVFGQKANPPGQAPKGKSYSAARKAFAQYQKALRKRCRKCDCGIVPPFTIISAALANKRFTLFDLKRTRAGQTTLEDGILYPIKGIEALLDTVAPAKRGKYDGLRIYFAFFPGDNGKDEADTVIPTNQCGKLTLIFVPTTAPRHKKLRYPPYHGDVTSRCLIVDGNSVKYIPMAVAQSGILNAQTGILAKFDSEGKKYRTRRPEFNETHSLWYSRGVLAPNGLRNGLRDILKCRDMSGDATAIYVRYAAFLNGYYRQYQLTLVFEPAKGNDKTSGNHTFFDLENPVATAGSDTGDPCPPPSNCSLIGDGLSPDQSKIHIPERSIPRK